MIFRRNTVCIVLLLGTLVALLAGAAVTACSPPAPVIPHDVVPKIQDNLGYALAPTWLPQGFTYNGPYADSSYAEQAFSGSEMVLGYKKSVSINSSAQLVLSYPATQTDPAAISPIFRDLATPDDATSRVEINGLAATLVRGTWSQDTMLRIQNLETPINPEWDYQGGFSITFAVEVPGKGPVWVHLFTVFPTDAVTTDDLVRIAKSVVPVD